MTDCYAKALERLLADIVYIIRSADFDYYYSNDDEWWIAQLNDAIENAEAIIAKAAGKDTIREIVEVATQEGYKPSDLRAAADAVENGRYTFGGGDFIDPVENPEKSLKGKIMENWSNRRKL